MSAGADNPKYINSLAEETEIDATKNNIKILYNTNRKLTGTGRDAHYMTSKGKDGNNPGNSGRAQQMAEHFKGQFHLTLPCI